MAASKVDALFTRVLEAHRDPARVTVTHSQQDSAFPVQVSSYDEPFFREVATVLSPDQRPRPYQGNKPVGETTGPHNFMAVKKMICSAMRRFLDSRPVSAAGQQAVITASLGVLRRSCAPTVPSHLSNIAANVLLGAVESVARAARPPVTSDVVSRMRQPGGASGGRHQQHQQQQLPPFSPWRGSLELGGESFPEAHVAGFLTEATAGIGQCGDPRRPMAPPPVTLSAQLASKIMCTLGVGAPQPNHRLQWGRNPVVAESLKRSARRVAERLRQERDWGTLADLVVEMATWKGAAEAEAVLRVELGQVIAEAMLAGNWEAARRAVSAAADGEPRRELARALIPSACDAHAFTVAKALIEENGLEKEFPELKEMDRKRRLIAAVKKPGWKMAQMMLERGGKHEHQLRVWLTRYMIELGDLPAAAQLMDHFNLHHLLPPLDPAEVEACARANAASHLQIPLSDSRVFVVDDWKSLVYAEQALARPPRVLGRPGADGSPAPGACCVGLDVESSPRDSKANVLQVATSSEVFLFDLPALGGGWRGGRGGADSGPTGGVELNRRFDNIVSVLFEDPSIVKLGFAFDQDLRQLRKCWPQVKGFRRVVSLLDIGPLSDEALGANNPSLSKTCQAWLGKPLDKTECASNWGHRPFTVNQVRYAALDAHCLVGIFEEILLDGGGRLAGSGHGTTVNGFWRQFLMDNTFQAR